MPIIHTLQQEFIHRLSNYTPEERSVLFYIFSKEILGFGKQEVLLNRLEEVDDNVFEQFRNIADHLNSGKPYQQILGKAECYGMTFFVDENVLIPRPETEELLEFAIQKINQEYVIVSEMKSNKESRESSLPGVTKKTLKILDIGTGSGIIPLILKKHFPEAEISSVDFSEKALQTAKKNADFYQLQVHFIHADYLNFDLKDNYDVIISNPPYIGINEQNEIADSVKEFEPKMALFSPTSDPLIFYRKIAQDSARYLNKNGLLFLEINQKLGPETLDLYNEFSNIDLVKDLSGNDRFIVGKK